MNKHFKKFFSYWPFYLGVIALVSFISTASISIRCKPTEKERLMIFAASGTIKVDSFVKSTKEATDESIRDVTVHHGFANQDSTTLLFGSTYAYCDFYVFPTSWVERVKPFVVSFDKATINSLIPNSSSLTLLQQDSSYIGIQIYDSNLQTGVMKSLISFDQENPVEDYFVLFRKESSHIGSLNGSTSFNALNAVNNLLTK